MREDTGFFSNSRRQELHFRKWAPDGAQKAVVMLLHGYAEHSGRYAHVAEFFTSRGYGFWSMDFAGHGKSDGVRADIKRFSLFVDDAAPFLRLAADENPGLPLFIYGHSMGGPAAVLMLSAIKDLSVYDDVRARLRGLILTGPSLLLAGTYSPLLIKMSAIMALLFPKLPVAPFDVSVISRDESVRQAYLDDELTYSGPTRARMGLWLLTMKDMTVPALPDIDLPVLILHGGADPLIKPESSQIVYDGIASKDKTLKFYPGLYHEIHNEPEKEEVFADIADWMGKRI